MSAWDKYLQGIYFELIALFVTPFMTFEIFKWMHVDQVDVQSFFPENKTDYGKYFWNVNTLNAHYQLAIALNSALWKEIIIGIKLVPDYGSQQNCSFNLKMHESIFERTAWENAFFFSFFFFKKKMK